MTSKMGNSAEQLRQVGLRLKEIREHRKISQEQLAKKAGVSLKTVHNWESGTHTIRARNLDQLLTALQCELKHLHEPPGSPKPPRRSIREREPPTPTPARSAAAPPNAIKAITTDIATALGELKKADQVLERMLAIRPKDTRGTSFAVPVVFSHLDSDHVIGCDDTC